MQLENTTEHDITINWVGGSLTVPQGRRGSGKVAFINGIARIDYDLWKALLENDPVVAAWEAGGELVASAGNSDSGQAMTEVERKMDAARTAAMKVAAKRIAGGNQVSAVSVDGAQRAAVEASKAQADDDKKKRG